MIILHLKGQIVPKARPRVTSNGAYMPEAYRVWKTEAILDLRSQFNREQSVDSSHPLRETKSVCILLQGKHSRRGDADNIAGGILDALVQAGVLSNDNLIVVPKLSIELDYKAKSPLTTTITINV